MQVFKVCGEGAMDGSNVRKLCQISKNQDKYARGRKFRRLYLVTDHFKKNVKAKFWEKRGDTQILNYTIFFVGEGAARV
jgi:hypothetical protein